VCWAFSNVLVDAGSNDFQFSLVCFPVLTCVSEFLGKGKAKKSLNTPMSNFPRFFLFHRGCGFQNTTKDVLQKKTLTKKSTKNQKPKTRRQRATGPVEVLHPLAVLPLLLCLWK
jgi:hypothetical protein